MVCERNFADAARRRCHVVSQVASTVAAVLVVSPGAVDATQGDAVAFDKFLDRLMIAESGGHAKAKNPRSTALGPFQFLESTFLDVTRRHFAAETGSLPAAHVLALRSDREFARKAAAAFTQDNADHLASESLPATFTNLRLAHLLGPAAAVRVLKAPAGTHVALWLGPAVIQANPFMAGMRVEQLIARSEREANTDGALTARPVAPGGRKEKPRIEVACDLGLASCRRWLALAERRLGR